MPRYESLGDNRIRMTFDRLDVGLAPNIEGATSTTDTALTGKDGQIASSRDIDFYTAPGLIQPLRKNAWASLNSGSNFYGVFRSSQGDFNTNFIAFGGDSNGFQVISASNTGEMRNATYRTLFTAPSASGTGLATSGTPFLYMQNRPIEYVSSTNARVAGVSAGSISVSSNIYWPTYVSSNKAYVLSRMSSFVDAATLPYEWDANFTGQVGSVGNRYKEFTGPVVYKEYFYYADGNILYRNDGVTETATLSLQSQLNIKSITVVNLDGNDWLALAVDYRNGSNNSLVYIYDGISTFLRQIIDTGSPGIQVVRQLENSLVTIHSDNAYGIVNSADVADSYIRIKTWSGGGKFREAYALPLGTNLAITQPVVVKDAAAIVVNDTLLFGLDSFQVTRISPDQESIYSFRLPNILNAEYIMDNGTNLVTHQLDFKNIYYNRYFYNFYVNNTTTTKTFATSENQKYSDNAIIRTLPFRFDIRHPGVIKVIEGQTKATPVGTTITLVHYPNQATAATTIGTVTTTNQRTFRFTNENGAQFPISDIDQLEFQFTGTTATSRPAIIMPFIIEAEIRKSN